MSKSAKSGVAAQAVASVSAVVVDVNGYRVDENVVMEYVTNPKRPGFKAHARYAAYSSCTTIAEYMELCADKYGRPDLRYDEEHGHLKLFVNGEQINVHEE